MKPFPKRLKLADLPTRIEKLERFSERTGLNVYVKRDDMSVWSGQATRSANWNSRFRRHWIGAQIPDHLRWDPVKSLPCYGRLRQRGWVCVPACCSARTIPTRSWTETISLIRYLVPTYALFRRRIIAAAGAKWMEELAGRI